jgi:hypothetical protein
LRIALSQADADLFHIEPVIAGNSYRDCDHAVYVSR